MYKVDIAPMKVVSCESILHLGEKFLFYQTLILDESSAAFIYIRTYILHESAHGIVV